MTESRILEKTSNSAEIPALLSKKWLCCYFNLWNGSRPNYKQLYKKVLTPEVLERVVLTQNQVKEMKTFDALTSARLKQVLSISCFLLLPFFNLFGQGNGSDVRIIEYQPSSSDYIKMDYKPVRDSILGTALVIDTVYQITITEKGREVLPVGRTATVKDLYSVTEGMIIVDPMGIQVPRVTNVFFQDMECRPVDSKRVLVFKH
ncbi:MAG: hypothetical protein R3A50_04740 [Saprospiraceae bacterium]